jgi:hypothetical protein
LQDESDDGSPRNKKRSSSDEERKVIGPKELIQRVPVVFTDGKEILQGEFDYDISLLDVEEYSENKFTKSV